MQLRARPACSSPGRSRGVEGYVESAAGGFLCALLLAQRLLERARRAAAGDDGARRDPARTSRRKSRRYQPSNITWAHIPPLAGTRLKKRDRYEAMSQRALGDLDAWLASSTAF